MDDNSILWISANGPEPRQIVERADGSEVYARYPWAHRHSQTKDDP